MSTTLPTKAAAPAGIFDSQPARRVARRALRRLEQHPHFRGRGRTIHVTFDDGTLTLSGRLSSFYLKQLLQEALQEVAGVQQIDNRVDVVCSNGISGVPD
jgi:osmotically-inducible protein OsmY